MEKHSKPNATSPLVSIVILNWNGLADTKVCLEHVRKLDYPNYEIVVVDNGSRKDSKDYLAAQKDIIYVDNPINRGFTGGHIDGLEHSSGDFILLLNNDAIIAQDYLSQAVKRFADDSVAVVGGRAYSWSDTQPALNTNNEFYSYLNVNPYSAEGIFSRSDYAADQEVNSVSGSSVLVRKSVIDEVGYLYDPFFAYFEETDLFARIKRAGYKVIYSPDLHIWHKISASSGADSPFVYYQLFRNRSIFAIRNFETSHVLRFLAIYYKIAFGSLARVILKPSSNPNMHRSYVKAAAYTFFHLPQLFALRSKLTKQLGASNYNHQIYGEQQGISFVVDATGLDASGLDSVVRKHAQDTNPLHEYVIVTPTSHDPEFLKKHPNIRFVSDRGYFEAHPITLGCLAARFDWMVLGGQQFVVTPTQANHAIASTLGKKDQVIAFTTGNGKLLPAIAIHQSFFDRVGGLGDKSKSFNQLIEHTVEYADTASLLAWCEATDAPEAFTRGAVSVGDRQEITQAVHRDAALIRSQHESRFDKLKQRYYRLYQFSTLIHWLFLPQVSPRLKLARLKNLFVFGLTLKPRRLATEIRHMRNEVFLNSGTAVDLKARKTYIQKRLDQLSKQPKDIPVFIICRDRVDSLTTLVTWLERHGMTKIVLIDNDSVYPPLVEYFAKTPYQVLRLFRNVGHTSPWKINIIRALVPKDFYIVTDPDVIPSEECPDDFLQYFLELHKKHFAHQKVGFGLRIDDLPDHYPPKSLVIDWEKQFWKTELSKEVYEAGVDTTFALYKPYTYFYIIHPSLRTGTPYTARHLPWYTDPKKVSVEDKFYHARVDQNVNSWNADALAERYVDELNKQK